MTGGARPTTLSRRRLLGAGCAALASLACGGVSLPTYALRVEPRWLEEVRRDVRLPHLPPELDGLRLALLADLHVNTPGAAPPLETVVRRTNAFRPDLILLLGDLITARREVDVAALLPLADLRAALGCYAVLGNHDVWGPTPRVIEALDLCGVRLLRDERLPVDVGGARLWLVGIEDAGLSGDPTVRPEEFGRWWAPQVRTARRLLRDLPPEQPRLLLVHNPDLNESLEGEHVDLALCGHTHGGQVRLPLLGPPLVPSSFGRKYAGGMVAGPAGPVYVSRGIGLTSPPVRLGCRPELSLLTLRATS